MLKLGGVTLCLLWDTLCCFFRTALTFIGGLCSGESLNLFFVFFFFLIMNYSLLFLELFEQIQIKQQEMLLFVVLFVRWFCFVGFDFSLIKQNNKAFQISMKSFFK